MLNAIKLQFGTLFAFEKLAVFGKLLCVEIIILIVHQMIFSVYQIQHYLNLIHFHMLNFDHKTFFILYLNEIYYILIQIVRMMVFFIFSINGNPNSCKYEIKYIFSF